MHFHHNPTDTQQHRARTHEVSLLVSTAPSDLERSTFGYQAEVLHPHNLVYQAACVTDQQSQFICRHSRIVRLSHRARGWRYDIPFVRADEGRGH